MGIVSPGFTGRRRSGADLPPGQYLTRDFPVLSAGPTPHILPEHWEFTVTTETGEISRWDWQAFLKLPSEEITSDLHCVTRWSKLGTTWRGVSLDTLLADVETAADYALVRSYGGYTTNLPLEDLLGGRAWIVYRYGGEELPSEHGGPLRLIVPGWYGMASVKWLERITPLDAPFTGFFQIERYVIDGQPLRRL